MRRSSVRLLFLVLCAFATGFFLAREPWIVYTQQRERAREAEDTLRRAEAEREANLREKAKFENSIGREQLARERGYVRKGEVRMGPDGP